MGNREGGIDTSTFYPSAYHVKRSKVEVLLSIGQRRRRRSQERNDFFSGCRRGFLGTTVRWRLNRSARVRDTFRTGRKRVRAAGGRVRPAGRRVGAAGKRVRATRKRVRAAGRRVRTAERDVRMAGTRVSTSRRLVCTGRRRVSTRGNADRLMTEALLS